MVLRYAHIYTILQNVQIWVYMHAYPNKAKHNEDITSDTCYIQIWVELEMFNNCILICVLLVCMLCNLHVHNYVGYTTYIPTIHTHNTYIT